MTFPIPRDTDVNDVVDRVLSANASDIPLSLANVLPSVRRRLAWLEISQQTLAERVKARAAELDVTLID